MSGGHGVKAALTTAFAASLVGAPALAQDAGVNALNPIAIAVFGGFVAVTLVITYWAASKTNSSSAFFVADGALKPWQNGLAIAGDFMSAATFLGITGAIFFFGYDAILLAIGIMVAWPIMLMVIAERFRNLGRFTLVDVISSRLSERPVRILTAISSLCVVIFYLIAQMVGAGKLIQLLFGFDYVWAVLAVSLLMILYVTFGGMLATTWVQMIKAVLLTVGGTGLAALVLIQFDFNPDAMLRAAGDAHAAGDAVLAPGLWLPDTLAVVTTALTMGFGVLGLPHILMRFFTVKSAEDARRSVVVATTLMGYFYILIIIIGFGAIAVLAGQAAYFDEDGRILGGSNMVALNTAHMLGGEALLGFMAAVTFATILAVVAGLTLSGSAAIAHDLYAQVIKRGNADPKTKLAVSRAAALALGALAFVLGLAFENQNVAVVAALALALAASVNFPVLFLAMYWPGLTTRGAVVGGTLTLIFSIVLIILSPSIWEQVFGLASAPFPYAYPTVFAMPFCFVSVWLLSITDRSTRAKDDRALFHAQFVRAETGSSARAAGES